VNESLQTILKAILNAAKFKGFLTGAHVSLPDGRKIFVKIQNTEKVADVPSPFKFSFLTTISGGGHTGTGYGSANNKLLAVEKSIAEALERIIFKNLKNTPYGTQNTNGWATHVSAEAAKQNALEELLERDAVLVHWFQQEPMTVTNDLSYPPWLSRWINHTDRQTFGFDSLKILCSTMGHLPTITIVMMDEFGHAVMSHATGRDLALTVCKALTETHRIAQIASTNKFMESSRFLAIGKKSCEVTISPEDHAMVYAHHLKFPKWIFGDQRNWQDCEKIWNAKYRNFWKHPIDFKFHQVVSSPLVVGYCTSPKVQNLFFGSTLIAEVDGLINFERLFSGGGRRELNTLPHFVA